MNMSTEEKMGKMDMVMTFNINLPLRLLFENLQLKNNTGEHVTSFDFAFCEKLLIAFRFW